MLQLNSMHFLTGEELSQSELLDLIQTAEQLRVNREAYGRLEYLQNKTVALLFDKPSLRTRVSFTVGVHELGGHVFELLGSQKKSEDPEDSIRVLQGMIHGVMIRTFEHSVLERMVSKATVPVINGLSDLHHPCQALADLLTIYQRFGKLEGLKLCYIGDGNNVLHSLLLLAPFIGVDVHYACPEGFQPDPAIVARARQRAIKTGAKIRKFKNPKLAAHGAHVLYTDVWTSMGQESKNAERIKAFDGYQINRELYEIASPSAIIMHCLPMVKGQEITEDMVEHPASRLFQQAENRLHAQKALMIGLFHAAAAHAQADKHELEYSHVI
jgi:ornithine carbamoyltransferase